MTEAMLQKGEKPWCRLENAVLFLGCIKLVTSSDYYTKQPDCIVYCITSLPPGWKPHLLETCWCAVSCRCGILSVSACQHMERKKGNVVCKGPEKIMNTVLRSLLHTQFVNFYWHTVCKLLLGCLVQSATQLAGTSHCRVLLFHFDTWNAITKSYLCGGKGSSGAITLGLKFCVPKFLVRAKLKNNWCHGRANNVAMCTALHAILRICLLLLNSSKTMENPRIINIPKNKDDIAVTMIAMLISNVT